MNFEKIKENFRIIGEALVDSGKELVDGIKPKSTEEKLKEAREYIKSNPELSKEEILEIIDDAYEDDPIDVLKEKVQKGYEKLMILYKNAPDQAKKVKEKIDKLVKEGSKKDLVEALKLEKALYIAQEGSKRVIKRVKHVLNSFVDEI